MAGTAGTRNLGRGPELAVEAQRGTNRLNSGFGFDRLAIGAYADGIHTRKEYAKMQPVRCLTAGQLTIAVATSLG
jgi:hypothetical protein